MITSDIKWLQNDIGKWADEKFGKDRLPGTILKSYEELGEFSKAQDPGELGDLFIVALDLAYLTNADMSYEIYRKMLTNRARHWKVDPRTGLAHHVKE